MAHITWAASAATDFREIIDWIINHSSATIAKNIAEKIDSEVSRLSEFPETGRIIPELEQQNITKYREIIVAPWRVFYTQESDRILILAVIDGRRNIEDILLRRNLR